MSGYLEVKYPSKSNLVLNPFKPWRRQWCILRPSPTCEGGGTLAVYCSEAGGGAGAVELPAGSSVRWAKSRTRRHAFAVFTAAEPRKPRVLLATQSFHDAQIWMEKIRTLLNDRPTGIITHVNDVYSVTVVTTELSRRTGLSGFDATLTLSPDGLHLSRSQRAGVLIPWSNVSDVLLITENIDKNKVCVLTINSDFQFGAGLLKVSCPLNSELRAALLGSLRKARGGAPGGCRASAGHKLSRSEGDLRDKGSSSDIGEVRRSSWSNSEPSEVTLDDTDLILLKHQVPGSLVRCSAARDLHVGHHAHDNSLDRRSLLSIASGIYEEIPEVPPDSTESDYCTMTAGDMVDGPEVDKQVDQPGVDVVDGPQDHIYLDMNKGKGPEPHYCHMSRGWSHDDSQLYCKMRRTAVESQEHTYERVRECGAYATLRRARRPPPLPPRRPLGTTKLGESWNSRMNKTPTVHSSLTSLPQYIPLPIPPHPATLPTKNKTFSVFRKRLKSDSRLPQQTYKENNTIETKKKRFDFTPTKDIFKSFKVGRKMKNLQISGQLSKAEAKSCEFLDETEHVTDKRCSKSVECLENDLGEDLSMDLGDVTSLALPPELVQLLMRRPVPDNADPGHYVPMSARTNTV